MAREVFFLSETRDGRCIRDKNKMVYHKNTILPRGDAIGFHTARPFESNKVGCAERAISGLTLVSGRKPSLAHTPCAEFIVIGVFDRGRIKGKKIASERTPPPSGHATVGVPAPCDPPRRPCFPPASIRTPNTVGELLPRCLRRRCRCCYPRVS